jgi:hypothetical protein
MLLDLFTRLVKIFGAGAEKEVVVFLSAWLPLLLLIKGFALSFSVLLVDRKMLSFYGYFDCNFGITLTSS